MVFSVSFMFDENEQDFVYLEESSLNQNFFFFYFSKSFQNPLFAGLTLSYDWLKQIQLDKYLKNLRKIFLFHRKAGEFPCNFCINPAILPIQMCKIFLCSKWSIYSLFNQFWLRGDLLAIVWLRPHSKRDSVTPISMFIYVTWL